MLLKYLNKYVITPFVFVFTVTNLYNLMTDKVVTGGTSISSMSTLTVQSFHFIKQIRACGIICCGSLLSNHYQNM